MCISDFLSRCATDFASSQASCPTASQPKSVSVSSDNTVFIAEVKGVEAIRSNQKVHELQTKFTPGSIATAGNTVAVGGEVRLSNPTKAPDVDIMCPLQDHKVHLYEWDGKMLKETGLLEGNRGPVGALAFSPDGNLLAAGDVSSDFLAAGRLADKEQ